MLKRAATESGFTVDLAPTLRSSAALRADGGRRDGGVGCGAGPALHAEARVGFEGGESGGDGGTLRNGGSISSAGGVLLVSQLGTECGKTLTGVVPARRTLLRACLLGLHIMRS